MEPRQRTKRILPLAWPTETELDYLETIGDTNLAYGTKRQHLQGYLRGALKRTVWGVIDGAVVIARARLLLSRMPI